MDMLELLMKLLNSERVLQRLRPISPFGSASIALAVEAEFPDEYQELSRSWKPYLSRAVNEPGCRVRKPTGKHEYVVMDPPSASDIRATLGLTEWAVLLDALEDATDSEWYLDIGLRRAVRYSASELKEARTSGRSVVRILRGSPQDVKRRSYALRKEFLASLPEGEDRSALIRAFNGAGAFSRLGEALDANPELAERWSQFRDFRLGEVAERWFASQLRSIQHDLLSG